MHVDGLMRLSAAMTKLINDEIKPNDEWDEDIVKMFTDPDELLLSEGMISSIRAIIEAMQPLALINNLSAIVIDEEVVEVIDEEVVE